MGKSSEVTAALTGRIREYSGWTIRNLLQCADSSGALQETGMNALPAVVRDVTFVGETHRYLLEAECGASIVLKQQHRFNVRSRAPAESVVIEWHVEDTLRV